MATAMHRTATASDELQLTKHIATRARPAQYIPTAEEILREAKTEIRPDRISLLMAIPHAMLKNICNM